MDAKAVPRPDCVRDYIKPEYWRDIQVARRYGAGLGIYEEVMERTKWSVACKVTQDFRNGGNIAKFDKEGNLRMESQLTANYHGGYPRLDRLHHKLFTEFGISQRHMGIFLHYYADGQRSIGSHRHDCWTALFSFGAPRILTIDGSPLLMRDGDLVFIGQQKHGVPFMPEVSEGRISIPVFFWPSG